MKRFLALSLIFLSITTLAAEGKVQVKKLNYVSKGSTSGELSITLKGNLETAPDLTIKDRMIQVSIPNAMVWPKIEKRITLDKNLDTTVMAYQFNKGLVRVRAILPYSIKGMEDRVSITISGNKINLHFPKLVSAAAPYKRKLVAKKANQNLDQYNESYLDKLIKEKEENKGLKTIAKKGPVKVTDQVNVALAGIEKEVGFSTKPSFSLARYIGKFVAFLGVVLLLFYGVVTLMKKGVLKKGKLGFLNSTKIVEVINTTHVGPKRSLMLIKAHNQVFLVANTEKGMEFLSEVNDIAGMMKDGEKSLAGSNFDSDLGTADLLEQNFKLKEDIEKPANVELKTNIVQDSVKLSQKIKDKVKTLKPLQ